MMYWITHFHLRFKQNIEKFLLMTSSYLSAEPYILTIEWKNIFRDDFSIMSYARKTYLV